MTRLTVAAAALFAGMTAFAANAQEAPSMAAAHAGAAGMKAAGKAMAVTNARTGRGTVAAVALGAGTPEAPAKTEKPAKPVKALAANVSLDRGMVYIPDTGDAPAKPVKSASASAGNEQGMVFIPEGGVDPTKTASVGKRARPTLNAVARKDVKGDAAEVVASAKAAGRGKYGSIISRYAATYGVPVALAHAVIRVESNYRANARGRAGEIGLMQIKPATARAMGYSGGAAGLYNPETNIRFGMKYLAMAHKLGGGSTCGTILKYNAGHGAKRMNPVSANYCRKVKRHLGA